MKSRGGRTALVAKAAGQGDSTTQAAKRSVRGGSSGGKLPGTPSGGAREAEAPASHPFPAAEVAALQVQVLAWFDAGKRDLPWRRTRDPYAIWISEVMLQQTRVETVKPYWARFLARFPDVEALAAAPLDDVLAHWSGLGYYARGRKLHEAAQAIVALHGGRLPADPAALAALPGFGPYTTAAVGSIGLGLDLAAVDGNVARVLTRWLCREGDPREAKALAFFRVVAAALLPRGRAGDWNQALMELGATACAPATPACSACPAATHCRALAAGRQQELPPRRKAKARQHLHLAAALVVRDGDLLLARRPDHGLFASLWELPSVEGDREALQEMVSAMLGQGAVVGEPLGSMEQTLTHRELKITVHAVAEASAAPLQPAAPYVDACFTDPAAPLPGGLSSATRKALRAAWSR